MKIKDIKYLFESAYIEIFSPGSVKVGTGDSACIQHPIREANRKINAAISAKDFGKLDEITKDIYKEFDKQRLAFRNENRAAPNPYWVNLLLRAGTAFAEAPDFCPKEGFGPRDGFVCRADFLLAAKGVFQRASLCASGVIEAKEVRQKRYISFLKEQCMDSDKVSYLQDQVSYLSKSKEIAEADSDRAGWKGHPGWLIKTARKKIDEEKNSYKKHPHFEVNMAFLKEIARPFPALEKRADDLVDEVNEKFEKGSSKPKATTMILKGLRWVAP